MAQVNHVKERQTAFGISWPICMFGAVLGLLLSAAALSGDAQGRVNLLYLLIIFVFVPCVSMVVSVCSLMFGKGLNLGRLARALPIWSSESLQRLHRLDQWHLSKEWLFMQSQLAALAYAVASLMVFVALLLVTDVNFVWRSTVLQPSDLQPILQAVALPWRFWEGAQPSQALLEATLDSRLQTDHQSTTSFALWWPFVLASILFYAVFLRGCFFLLARKILLVKLAKDIELSLRQQLHSPPSPQPDDLQLGEVTHSLPNAFMLANWGGFDSHLLGQLPEVLLGKNIVSVGPMAPVATSEPTANPFQVLLVKAWEPPLGELQDYLAEGAGVILPLDFVQQKVAPPKTSHLNEWRRFSAALPKWQVYLPAEWVATDSHKAEVRNA